MAVVIRKEEWDVNRRLAEIDMARIPLLKVRDMALGAAADATPLHPANSAGTFSYHHGVFGLRDGFLGKIWIKDRPNGIEVIRNIEKNITVGFQNVDVACSDSHPPEPRSDKGAGAERTCEQNLFGSLPKSAARQDGIWKHYFLMVAENGAVELSCPIIENGTFVDFIERIYLSDGSDFERVGHRIDDSDSAKDFDPQVTRKRG